MRLPRISRRRIRQLLEAAPATRVLVIGDVMLDHFIWGSVARISPEAPVPIVELASESFMPGGAGNVARNLTSLRVKTELFSTIGLDTSGRQLKRLLVQQGIGCSGLSASSLRPTSVKTRVVALTQQVVRIDRESRDGLDGAATRGLLGKIERALPGAAAVIVCDYGKGIVTQSLLDGLKRLCRENAVWLSLDPKPVHRLDLSGLSLITPNRKEAFELAHLPDESRNPSPLADPCLMATAEKLLRELKPAVLLITLGELGMLLCERHHPPFHIPTTAQEVYDVSGAGDTVIGSFTMAVAAGASPLEAAILSNHAAGIVVGKVGTATVTQDELLRCFKSAGQ